MAGLATLPWILSVALRKAAAEALYPVPGIAFLLCLSFPQRGLQVHLCVHSPGVSSPRITPGYILPARGLQAHSPPRLSPQPSWRHGGAQWGLLRAGGEEGHHRLCNLLVCESCLLEETRVGPPSSRWVWCGCAEGEQAGHWALILAAPPTSHWAESLPLWRCRYSPTRPAQQPSGGEVHPVQERSSG